MNLITRYLLKNIFITLIFITISLTFAVWLTQILRFLELIVDAGAPLSDFIELLLLIIPKFLEIVLPIAVVSSILFVYNKLTLDNEMVVMRAAGLSPRQLSRPALYLAIFFALVSFIMSGWITPLSKAKLLEQRQKIQTEYSALLLREGVFNTFGEGLTVYVREKLSNGLLSGLIIHNNPPPQTDTNKENQTHSNLDMAEAKETSTVIAKSGQLSGDKDALQLIVREGSRQQKDSKTGYVSRLDFEQYIVDITPKKKEVPNRWQKSDERTLPRLFKPDLTNPIDVTKQDEFHADIHRRLSSPFLVVSFSLIALACLFGGGYNRRGQHKKIILAIALVFFIQTSFLAISNIAEHNNIFVFGLYIISIIPGLLSWVFLRERFKIRSIFPQQEKGGLS